MNWKGLLIIITTIAMGMLLVNQAFGWHYKTQFLKTPCTLCEELNPHLRECFKIKSTYSINKLSGDIIGSPETIEELNRREGENYSKFYWT